MVPPSAREALNYIKSSWSIKNNSIIMTKRIIILCVWRRRKPRERERERERMNPFFLLCKIWAATSITSNCLGTFSLFRCWDLNSLYLVLPGTTSSTSSMQHLKLSKIPFVLPGYYYLYYYKFHLQQYFVH